jgi:hypothetical protein
VIVMAAVVLAVAVSSSAAGVGRACPVPAATQAIRGNVVACVGARRLTRAKFDHWMYIAAKGNAEASPGTPVIVPTDPPRFKNCIKQARAQISPLKKTSATKLRAECNELFKSLSHTVLDFLIKADWYQNLAAGNDVVVTNRQAWHELNVLRRTEFRTHRQYRRFLKQTGQGISDVLFRVRVNIVYRRLIKIYGSDTALNAAARQALLTKTYCHRLYTAPHDCGHIVP